MRKGVNAMLATYRDLKVWQRAMDLVEDVYLLTRGFPAEEKYALASQVQRAAVSIPANIAEGYGRATQGDYLRHLSIARGSLMELETLLTIAVRLGFTSREKAVPIWEPTQEVGRMLRRLMVSLHRRSSRSRIPQTPNPEPDSRGVSQ